MKAHANEFPVKKMSEVLGVSRSGYYKWLVRSALVGQERTQLDEQIKDVYKSSRSTYGSPRVYDALKNASVNTSKSTVARRMKAMKITPKKKKRFRYTTDSKHDKVISPNLLDQNFEVAELGKVWVSDITYIAMKSGFAYLTSVIDLADRMVVGWSLSDNMTDAATTIAAFKKAVINRGVKEGLIFHSDRGSQYASDDFRALLKDYKCVQSMSRKGNCWDNAVAESFFKTIKVEELYHHKFESLHEVWSVVFDYIDGWYNTHRIHSTLKGKSPLEMAKLLES